MALDFQFIDSFDYYTDLTQQYDIVDITGASLADVAITAGVGVNGTAGVSIASLTGDGLSITNPVGGAVPTGIGAAFALKVTPTNTLVMGGAINIPALQTSTATTRLMAFIQNNQIQLDLAVTSAGVLIIRSGGGIYEVPTTLGSGPNVTFGTYFFYELKIFSHPVNGTATLNVWTLTGSKVQYAITNINTAPSGSSTIDTIQWGVTTTPLGSNTTLAYNIDNIYYATSNFTGLFFIDAYLPTGDGDTTDWTRHGAATNWQALAQNPAIPASIYNSSTTPGNVNLSTFTPNIGTNSIVSAKVSALAQGSGVMKIRAKSGSMTADSSNISLPSTGPKYHAAFFSIDPNTGLPWTWTPLANAQFGLNDISNAASGDFILTIRPRGLSVFIGVTGGLVFDQYNSIDSDSNPPTTYAIVTCEHGSFSGGATTLYAFGLGAVAATDFLHLNGLFPNGCTANMWGSNPIFGSGQGHCDGHYDFGIALEYSFFGGANFPLTEGFGYLDSLPAVDAIPQAHYRAEIDPEIHAAGHDEFWIYDENVTLSYTVPSDQQVSQLVLEIMTTPLSAQCSLSISSSSTTDDQPVLLSWSTSFAASFSISGIGDLPLSGSIAVNPQSNTTYVGTAVGGGGSGTCSVSVVVCPEWLRRFPDTMLLDIAGNDAIFPTNIRQCAMDFLQTRQVFIAIRAPKITAYVPIREVEQNPFVVIVNKAVTFASSEAPQLPVPFSPTLI